MDESGKHVSNSNNIFAFLDIKIGTQKAGRVIIELYADVVPKTVANFLALIRGDKTSSLGDKLHYKGSIFHRDDNDILMVDSDGCFNCDQLPKVKGRFGLAWVSESPDCPCPEPVGWQVEFLDTPSKVEQKCQEMVRWINCPPLPRCDPCPPDELCSPCNPPRCNPCAPKCNPCLPKCGLPKCTCKSQQPQQQSCCCKRKTNNNNNNNKKCCCPSNSRREKRNCYPPIGGPCCRGKSPRRRSPQRCCTCGNDDRDQLPKCTCDDVPVKDTNEGVIGSSSVIPQFLVQTGELFSDGREDESIYGKSFEDENFSLLHGSGGAVGMANNGPNTNSAQFYITTVPCSHLDGLNVVFGYVRKGLSIIRELAEMPRIDDCPTTTCLIEDCGVIKQGEDFKINESDGTLDVYPPWPDDYDSFPTENVEKIVSDIKTSGNYYFNKKKYEDSDRKYKKVLRYIDWINHCNYNHNCIVIKKLKIQTLLNLAAVKLKTQNYVDVVKICTQVLDMDKKQSKAFYRRGQARLKLEDYDKAINDFEQARKLVPNNIKIQQDHLLAKQKKQIYLQKERIACSRMFQ